MSAVAHKTRHRPSLERGHAKKFGGAPLDAPPTRD